MKTLAISRIALLAFVFTLSAAASSYAASIGYLLTLTENSSTSLSLSYNGPSNLQITNSSADNWTVTVLNGTAFFSDFTWDWTEPEEPGEVNEVYAGSAVQNSFFTVESDESLLEYAGNFATLLPNNGITPMPVGLDGGTPIFLQFNDLAAGAETNGVPESGASLGLLAVSVAGLLGLHRVRWIRAGSRG